MSDSGQTNTSRWAKLRVMLCYAITSVYTKKKAISTAPAMMATGSQLAAALVLLPALPFSPVHGEATPFTAVIMLAFALLCTAVAFFLYFRLIADIGPVKALTVTFLIPLFALVWGAAFLREEVSLNTVAGCALVIWATWLVAFGGAPAGAAQLPRFDK